VCLCNFIANSLLLVHFLMRLLYVSKGIFILIYFKLFKLITKTSKFTIVFYIFSKLNLM